MKVGDYVRLPDGIHKIKHYEYRPEYENCHCMYLDNNDYGLLFTNKYLIKSSPNIIDLIEVGDYVNGCLIVEISKDLFIKGQINLWTNMIISEGEPFPNEYYKAKILEKDIKSIVTKEQFSQMEFKVGE